MLQKFNSMLDQAPSRFAFWLGVSQGVAISFIAGFFILLNIFMGGEGIASIKKAVVKNNPPSAAQPTYPEAPTQPSAPVEVKITNSDHLLGSSKAKVTIVEFSDFQCPFCGRFYPSVKQALAEYKDKIRFVYRHFPLDSIHPNAKPAAEASECAGDQGKFWEFHDKLFENQDKLGDAFYQKIAGDLKLDVKKFNGCLASDKYLPKIDADYQSGIAAGVQGTPHTLVNGVAVSGAVPYEQLKAVIDAELKK